MRPIQAVVIGSVLGLLAVYAVLELTVAPGFDASDAGLLGGVIASLSVLLTTSSKRCACCRAVPADKA
ncbi:MAG: hypothetical protein KDB18_05335 [Salinibacterium sp.]|nr:hypothetical protein [Salinibacterium sp.]